jgi:predicted SprT family Zn-dependent metalloprotease
MKIIKKIFAKGRRCQCGHYMFAEREDVQPQGSWVYYVCNSCGWKVKEFES